jgi:hypothetical protein
MPLVSVSIASTQRDQRQCILVLREDGGDPTSWLVPIGATSPEELAAALEKFAAKIRENGK